MPAASSFLDIGDLHGWYGESHVLHGVTRAVGKGETIAILGRNGAGKTSTLRAVMGILRKRRGVVRLDGTDLLSLAPYHIPRIGIGYVPEERGIFSSLTVEENLLLPTQVSEHGLPLDEIHALFPNLHERRNSSGTKLSGGEQQMLAIARILRTGARVLLLDEPTEGLAPVIVQRIGAVIGTLKARGYTIVLVEQNFRFAARLADRLYVMENGKIADVFATSELDARMSSLHTYLGV
jgi:branched-chain amino acid transport system ATP-binding protein